MNQFPDELPQLCPPQEARSPEGEEAFRLTEPIPTLDDVKSQYEMGRGDSNNCSHHALSFYTSKENALRLIRGYKRFADKVVSRIELDPDWGLAKWGKKRGRMGCHVDLWLYRQVDRSKIAQQLIPVTVQDESGS